MPSSVIMTSPPGGPRPGLFRHLFGTLELIKFSHSVFALPFALSAMLVAARGVPGLWTLLWILWRCLAAGREPRAFSPGPGCDCPTLNPRTKRRPKFGARRTTLAL